MRIVAGQIGLGRAVLALLLVGSVTGTVALAMRLNRPAPEWKFTGRAMGTVYHVKIAAPLPGLTKSQAAKAVADSFEHVEALISTYRSESEIVRFNRSSSLDWQSVSPDTAQIVSLALEVGRLGGGGYDITVAPLVDLWGFGPVRQPPGVPERKSIEEALRRVGPSMIEARLDPPALRKKHPGVRIDLSSIGEGCGIDRAAKALERLGITRYCIELGGDLLAHGLNAHNQPWRVAVEAPAVEKYKVQRVVSLQDAALCTSGDYRNYVEVDGVRYCHIIDARTGYPVTHKLASASVIHPRCEKADAWATALMAAGPDEGYEIAVREKLAALFIIREGERFVVRTTPIWPE